MRNVELIFKDRKSAVLSPSQLPCLSRTASINLTSGCAHECLYCYGRSYSQYPGDGRVVLYGNTLEKLRNELRRKRVKPRFVYFSPSTDVFQPIDAVQGMAYDIFEFLLARGVGVAFVTKGVIPDKTMALFEAHPSRIRAQIGLISLNPSVLGVFEPGCVSAEVRLEQTGKLIRMGVETEVRVDPILPGITDDVDSLDMLFCALAAEGLKRVALNVLYLRAAQCRTLREKIAEKFVAERLLQRFVPGTKIRVCNGKFSQTALPRFEREEIFARAIRIANAHGIRCHTCGCMNPDISSGNCNLTGEWGPEQGDAQQLNLL